ncbi:MAG: primosomal protein N' [Candidatus Hydrogenedentes bacterium]|nr:primosomal protein N' [Candidatus Hydrogenedentota bacterium]MBI3117054.1 primosomal protein N' [Candidatus Hydrogenedentota bacterium]
MSAPAFAEIVLPVPIDKAFTYEVPQSLRHRIRVGMRAIVPVKGRVETGYVVTLKSGTELEQVKALLDLPDDGPVFSPAMIQLCRWMADYYCCSWGEALQCAVPAGLRVGTKMRYRLIPDALQAARYTERQQRVIAALGERGPLTEGQLAAACGRQALSNTLQSLVRRGIILAESVLQEESVSIRTETYVQLVEEAILVSAAQEQLQRRAPKQAAVYLDLLHGEPERPASVLYEKHGATAQVLAQLEKKGLIRRVTRELYRAPELSHDGRASAKHALNADQQAAYAEIIAALEQRTFQTFLLKGITGSGKTEVYLQAIERALAVGRDAIILVPEISLTPQTVGRFYARFQQNIAVLHSALSMGERYDEWRRALRGEVRIVVGARSAIFAPLPDVGIIVVDEEHDNSYKQNETPRYHARDVAIMRARDNNAVCLLGSATPSIESYYNTTNGKSKRLELKRRATAASLPEVKIVDMRIETKEASGQIILSRVLEEAVRQRVSAGEQVILLLNRRGFSPFVLCPHCGWVASCENCQVSLTYHSHGAVLKCHYCRAQHPRPEVCGECNFNPLIYLGTGTQRAEDYLMRTFAEARIERMDADTTSSKGAHAKILGRFAAGEIDILIGTQMLAKGHDYPGVTLVGVINADTGLAMPDFRAAENTFQLLTQVAGRAGRGDRPGEVFIQTYRPRHYAIQAAAQQDYAAFYAQEIYFRENASYPPFRRMAHFLLESLDPEAAERNAMLLRRIVREMIEALHFDGVEVLGPSPSVLRRINKKYRWNLGLLSRSAQRLNTLTRATREGFQTAAKTSKVQLKIDLDPYGTF